MLTKDVVSRWTGESSHALPQLPRKLAHVLRVLHGRGETRLTRLKAVSMPQVVKKTSLEETVEVVPNFHRSACSSAPFYRLWTLSCHRS